MHQSINELINHILKALCWAERWRGKRKKKSQRAINYTPCGVWVVFGLLSHPHTAFITRTCDWHMFSVMWRVITWLVYIHIYAHHVLKRLGSQRKWGSTNAWQEGESVFIMLLICYKGESKRVWSTAAPAAPATRLFQQHTPKIESLERSVWGDSFWGL